MLCAAPPPPFWKACGAPSAAAFMMEAAAEACSFRGARPSPEKMSWFLINTGADRGDAGYAEFWLSGTGRDVGCGALRADLPGERITEEKQLWTKKLWRRPSQKPVKGATC